MVFIRIASWATVIGIAALIVGVFAGEPPLAEAGVLVILACWAMVGFSYFVSTLIWYFR